MSEITVAIESNGQGQIIARYDLTEIQEKAYQQGRADAIEEYNKKIKECCHIVGSCDFEDLERIAEQLKGENRMIIDSEQEQEQVKVYNAYYNKGYKKGFADGSLSVTEEIKDKVIDECIEILKKMKGE